MDYRKGSIGRVFAVRMDNGDDVLNELSGLAVKENIKSAFFMMLGAMDRAELVTGPKEKAIPPVEVWSAFNDVRQIIGVGNIIRENNTPKIHLHAVAGSSKEMIMGCVRKTTQAFMYLDICIIEMDIPAERIYDKNMGASPVRFQ